MSRPEASILIVDDEESVARTLTKSLERAGYANIRTAASFDEASRHLANSRFDLVLTDMQMPGRSGLDLLTIAPQLCPDVATMMITGIDDTKLAEKALNLGAYGYVVKPFKRNEVVISVANALRRRELEIDNKRHREHLEEAVRIRTSALWESLQQSERAEEHLKLAQEETIQRLSLAAEFRDDETFRHIERMSRYCGALARCLGEDSARCELIRLASKMHDIGKIGVADSVLLKPGKLTSSEFEIMKTHADIGHQILRGSRSELGRLGEAIAWTHHEKFDGNGYPRGLKADEIPVEGRLAAVADVFDALTTDRVYRKAFPVADALRIMRDGRGTHFDPTLLDGFLDVVDVILLTKEELGDRHAA